jgi:hypothetical protein
MSSTPFQYFNAVHAARSVEVSDQSPIPPSQYDLARPQGWVRQNSSHR